MREEPGPRSLETGLPQEAARADRPAVSPQNSKSAFGSSKLRMEASSARQRRSQWRRSTINEICDSAPGTIVAFTPIHRRGLRSECRLLEVERWRRKPTKTFRPNTATITISGSTRTIPQRMIIGDDGGAQVTYNGGETWSTTVTQPTSQFYRVTTDNHVPYRIYALSKIIRRVRIFSQGRRGSITESDWKATAGGESGHISC